MTFFMFVSAKELNQEEIVSLYGAPLLDENTGSRSRFGQGGR